MSAENQQWTANVICRWNSIIVTVMTDAKELWIWTCWTVTTHQHRCSTQLSQHCTPIYIKAAAYQCCRLVNASTIGSDVTADFRQNAQEQTEPGTEWVQALADISRLALGCHSNETRAPIANPPNRAQLQGTTYHCPKLHPGPCSSVGMQWGTDRHTAVTNIHFAPHEKRNKRRKKIKVVCWFIWKMVIKMCTRIRWQ